MSARGEGIVFINPGRPGEKRTSSWWTEPRTRQEFSLRAAQEAARMVSSQAGVTLSPVTSDAWSAPVRRKKASAEAAGFDEL
mgnify:CR=1 FL=1